MNPHRSHQVRTMVHQYSKLGSSSLFGPDCQKGNVTTLATKCPQGHGQKRRKERHEEGSEGVNKGEEEENRKAREI